MTMNFVNLFYNEGPFYSTLLKLDCFSCRPRFHSNILLIEMRSHIILYAEFLNWRMINFPALGPETEKSFNSSKFTSERNYIKICSFLLVTTEDTVFRIDNVQQQSLSEVEKKSRFYTQSYRKRHLYHHLIVPQFLSTLSISVNEYQSPDSRLLNDVSGKSLD